ncbi:hypothetical protein D3C75_1004650 [compost metagenome]
MATHQLVAIYCLPSLSIPPHDTAGGLIPSPRKLSEASIIIVVATFIPDRTMNEERILGKICLSTIRPFFAPTDLAALTKSRSLMLSTSPRTTRV